MSVYNPPDSQHWLTRAQEDLERTRIMLDVAHQAHRETIAEHTKLILEHHKVNQAVQEAHRSHGDTMDKLHETKRKHAELSDRFVELQQCHVALENKHSAVRDDLAVERSKSEGFKAQYEDLGKHRFVRLGKMLRLIRRAE